MMMRRWRRSDCVPELRLGLCMCMNVFSALGLGVGDWQVLHLFTIPKQTSISRCLFLSRGSTSAKALESALRLTFAVT